MELKDIRKMPQTVEAGGAKIHESVMRSFHILNKVMELVQKGTPPEVTAEIWQDLVSAVDTEPRQFT